MASFGGAPSLAYSEMDPRRTLMSDFALRGSDGDLDDDEREAALVFFVEMEVVFFGDENHARAFALELADAYARARRRAAARCGLSDEETGALRPISAASYSAWGVDTSVCRPCARAAPEPAPEPADGGYEEEKHAV